MRLWGIPYIKGQGLTLEKVVGELGDKDFSAGLSFVGNFTSQNFERVSLRTRFDQHTKLKKQRNETMLMLKKRY